ncbi:hypothetical protein RFI_02020 [Reticulomyxa filosa]|uniref:Uncharacterized protein n=1 Tax=Reticulomyxa filosa TaxID=46433 RepID=X6PAG5_RETFI|nr:hypothetical protein RFI_02020 [Reticulomyxa filosa]|eukprot:ETO35054.1 hypothetical protein RFI_02020 [Reticulomyxa filosa]
MQPHKLIRNKILMKTCDHIIDLILFFSFNYFFSILYFQKKNCFVLFAKKKKISYDNINNSIKQYFEQINKKHIRVIENVSTFRPSLTILKKKASYFEIKINRIIEEMDVTTNEKRNEILLLLGQVQLIIQNWLRILNIKLGWINDFDRLYFSDDQAIVSCSLDTTIRLWDVKSENEIQKLEGHSNWITSIDVSPNDDIIASCSYDRTIRICG